MISSISLNYNIETQKSQAYLMLDSTYADFARSDSLCVVGTLKEGFGDYNAFMYRPQLIAHSKPSPPDLALLLKTTFASHLREALRDDDINNLSLGYLVGEKGQMVDDFKDNLKRVGMTHAVVASGFHLSVLIGFAKRYLKKISRLCALFGSILLLFLFVSIAGFSPSLARAGIVTLLSLLAWYFGRRFHPGRTITYAAALTLFVEPSYITNLAWLLSFLSYIGILIVAPIIREYLFGREKPGFLADSIIQSVSAQLLCLPILVYSFGEFSILGVVANLLISPTISVAMALSLLVGLFSMANIAPLILILATKALIGAHIWIIESLAQIPWAILKLEPTPHIFLLYIPLVLVIVLIKIRTGFSFRPTPELEKSEKNGKIYTCE